MLIIASVADEFALKLGRKRAEDGWTEGFPQCSDREALNVG